MTRLPRRPPRASSFPFSSCKVKSGALSLAFMDTSPAKSTLRAQNGLIAPVASIVHRILHRTIWRRRAVLLAFVAVLTLVPLLAAQGDRPQINPGERKPTQKKDAGPRAVAVLQVAANGKASLVPIAILVNNKFWDASAYKADPVPMSLDSGVVYEGEQSGSSLGLFTVNSALHSNDANSQTPWLGTGSWRLNGTDEPKKAITAAIVPVGVDTEDEPPRLTHNEISTSASQAPSTPASNTPPAGASNPSSPSNSDGPPRLSKPPSDSSPQPNTSPSSTSTNADAPAPSPPAPSASSKDSKPAQANIPASDSGTTEAGRPRLRRGKPAESFAGEDIPGYSRPGAAPTSAANDGKVVPTAATTTDIKLIPAISDADGPPPHSYVFEWLKGEEEDRHKQMTQAAKQQVRDYVIQLAKNRISAKPEPKTARRMPLPEPILENEKMVAYDLWNSNQPIIILTADAHMPATPAKAAHSEAESDAQYFVTLAAYPDIYGNLRKLYGAVTDKFHLDVTPRLQLVDAVDADGDGRGELLFRETSDQGNGWIIYRATADKLWKMYDSLNPEP